MEAQIKLFRIFGIQIGLHYSWIIIALLIALSLAGHFHEANPQWGPTVTWASAILTSLLFFTAIVLHELSHAAVAKARGLPVRSITLFALGGVAQIEQEASDARTEFWMGIVGPITSVVIGALCLALAAMLGWTPTMLDPTHPALHQTPLMAILAWLGIINIALAVFNMIPGFPLDGGRVLRAIIWWITGNSARSTRLAARAGQLVAFGFILFGLLRFFTGGSFGGLWLAFIGWFLLDAARSSRAQVEVVERLRGVRVGDVMTRDCPRVDSKIDLQTFVHDYLLRTGQRCFIVEEDDDVAGLITPHEVKNIDRERWPQMTIGDVMRPFGNLHSVTPSTSLNEALERMGREDVNQLPVVSNRKLAGVISRGHIVRLLQTRAELQG